MKISRRAILRGGSAALTLPWLEAMGDQSPAELPAAAPPRRLVCMYFPLGVCNEEWYPAKVGPGLELSPTLRTLERVKSQVTVVSGLRHPLAPKQHKCALGFLTGRDPQREDCVSVDQIVANAYGRATRFPSLQFSKERGEPISYTGEGTPIPAASRPAAIFERLFVPESQEARASARRTAANQRSILDTVRDDARQLSVRLGARDRRKLDEYLYSVRDVERIVQQSEAFIDTPKPTVDGGVLDCEWDGDAADVRVKYDLMFLALQTDSTRVVSWLIESEHESPAFPHLGLTDRHNLLSHHGGDAKRLANLAASDRFYVSELARFLEKLQAERIGDETLLDTTLVLYGSGLNNGDGFKNGTGAHNNDKMPLLLAGGRGLGIAGDRHIKIDDGSVPATNLHLAMLHALGLRLPSFSDSTGPLGGLT
ncbi:MAG: DUF1552 domain-containing protein [Planctomycetaceae bacterium]|jgi:hypothetical protein|nr:DUF1552 domain-containing protein [Planctomycetaceae bacterium]